MVKEVNWVVIVVLYIGWDGLLNILVELIIIRKVFKKSFIYMYGLYLIEKFWNIFFK